MLQLWNFDPRRMIDFFSIRHEVFPQVEVSTKFFQLFLAYPKLFSNSWRDEEFFWAYNVPVGYTWMKFNPDRLSLIGTNTSDPQTAGRGSGMESSINTVYRVKTIISGHPYHTELYLPLNVIIGG